MAPVEMLADVIDSSPSIAAMMDDLVGPIITERQQIRDHLHANNYVRSLPPNSMTTTISCVDGALTKTPLAIGDHHCALSVAVDSRTGEVDVAGKRSWATFLAHSDASDKLAKAVMLTNELILAAEATQRSPLTLLDGSHATHITAITDVLGNTNAATCERFLDAVGGPQVLHDTIRATITTPTLLSQQKQDSSTNLWDALARDLNLTGTGLPDKPLASLILDDGEVLTHPACEPAWSNVAANVATAKPGTLRAAISDLVQPVAQNKTIIVSHIKPRSSEFALRIEHKATPDSYTELDMLAAIADDCAPPHVQEPFVQYIADKVAKSVSAAATLQLETARIDASSAGYAELVPYILHYYRT